MSDKENGKYEEQVAEERITEEQVAEERITEEQVAEEQAAEERITEEQVAEELTYRGQVNQASEYLRIRINAFYNRSEYRLTGDNPLIGANDPGLRVLGISCITDMAVGEELAPLTHEQVMAVAERTKPEFIKLVKAFLGELSIA